MANNPIIGYDEDGRIFVELAIGAWLAYNTIRGYEKGGIGGAVQGFMYGVRTAMVTYVAIQTGATVFSATGSMLAGEITGSLTSSTLNYGLTGGESDFSVSAGPFSYNFSKGKAIIANPFDKESIFKNTLDWMSWAPFLYDTRNVPGMKYVRFVNSAPNTIIGATESLIKGDKYRYFDWDKMAWVFEGSKESLGSVVSMDKKYIDWKLGLKDLSAEDIMKAKEAFAHEFQHVFQSGIFGGSFIPLYYLPPLPSALYDYFFNNPITPVGKGSLWYFHNTNNVFEWNAQMFGFLHSGYKSSMFINIYGK